MKKITYIISKIIEKLQIPVIKESDISKKSKVSSKSSIYYSSVKKFTYIGKNSTIICTDIGAFTSIANNVIIGAANHPINWVSTSPVFHTGRNILKKNFANHKFETNLRTIIGNDVWIGNGVQIKNGVTIGDGAIIGMGAIVTKSVGSYEIWAGNPAKLIKKRYSDEVTDKLISIKWWNLEESKIERLSKSFNDVDLFINEVQKLLSV